jgi:GNAT superfamily N-acetyltransferase
MTIAFSFGLLSPAIEEAYRRLFPDDVSAKSPERLRWRFLEAPHGPGYFATAYDTGSDNRIIGIIGLISCRLRVKGNYVQAYQAVDLIVDPAYRGRGVFNGLGATLFEGVRQIGGRIVWGFPNEKAAHTWFGRFRWVRMGTAPFVAKPLRTRLFLRRVPALRRLDVPLAIWRGSTLPNVHVIEHFDANAESLWEQFRGDVGCALDRGADLLNWRLVAQPDASYRNVAAYGPRGEMSAFVSTTLREKHNSRICYVMEAMSAAGEERVLGRLLRQEVTRAAREGADLALAWCSKTSPNREAFKRAGFRSFPERLRPVRIFFGAKILDESLSEGAGDVDQWYISYIDSDTT